MTGYQNKVIALAGEKQKSEVQLVINLFQSVLDIFIRGEIKKEEEPAKVIHKIAGTVIPRGVHGRTECVSIAWTFFFF